MANGLYALGREGFLRGEISFNVATIRVALVEDYTVNLSTHQFVSDVTGAGGILVATSDPLTGKTTTAGTANADDVLFLTVGPGDPVTSIIVFQASAVTGGADVAATAQRLIAFYDTSADLPFAVNGSDVLLEWNASGLFTL